MTVPSVKLLNKDTNMYECAGNSNLYFVKIEKAIDKYIKLWPGGKKNKDSVTNSIGDTLFFVLGWLSASMLNNK